MGDIIVRQRAVEGILMRDESDWNVIAPRARIRSIGSPVIHRPIQVPRTSVVGDWIIASGLFSNPKHRGHNARFPRVTLYCRVGTGRDENLRFHFEQCLLTQPHCVLGKIRRRRVGRSGLFIPESFRGDSDSQTETSREKSPHVKAPASSIRSPAIRQDNFSELILPSFPIQLRLSNVSRLNWRSSGLG